MPYHRLSDYAQRDLQRVVEVLTEVGANTSKLLQAIKNDSPVLADRLRHIWRDLSDEQLSQIPAYEKRLYAQVHGHLTERVLNPDAVYAEDKRIAAVQESLGDTERVSKVMRVNLPKNLLPQVEALSPKQLGDLIARALGEQ